MLRYFTMQKKVGETPLEALERGRISLSISKETPLAYAGRLDPMASGTLLILVGNECKKQKTYHGLDKEYQVEMLLGVASDSGDVLGRVTSHQTVSVTEELCKKIFHDARGAITLPYPHFSSKTIQGKPLHTWTLEGKLGEIEIPTKTSTLYRLKVTSFKTITKKDVLNVVRPKIETIKEVVDPKKALGADFRRVDVRVSWDRFEHEASSQFQIITFVCVASSGTYMRSLVEFLAERLGTHALAYSINRTKIGLFKPIIGEYGLWLRTY